MNKALIRKNLEKLLSTKDARGMRLCFSVYSQENAKRPHSFLSFLPFHYDPTTGSILCFTPDPPEGQMQQGSYTLNNGYRPNSISDLYYPPRIIAIEYGRLAPKINVVHVLNSTALLFNNLPSVQPRYRA